MKEYFKDNERLWDEKTPVHLKSEFYDLQGFLSGKTSLMQPELEDLPASFVNGKSMLHLQCHFGQDSLSFARMGAKVTGIDLSGNAIAAAKELNKQLALDATFVKSNLYDLPENLEGQFDIVFTSYGTITWLPDLVKWAKIINHFLKPGGTFYIVETHPLLYLFDYDNHTISYNYFNSGKPYSEEVEGTYADPDSDLKATEHFWCHSLHEVIQPLLQEGLQLVDFKEYDYSPYDCFPNMEKDGEQVFRYKKTGTSIAHLFSLKMIKAE